jgi:hypothetical protein
MTAPRAKGHTTWRAVVGERLDDLERQEERSPGAKIGTVVAAHIEDACVDAGRLTHDRPALVANADGFAADQ